MKYLLSIIVPIYNVEKYLNECINSIINQTYSNLEILLIDDGSTDNSGMICDNWEKKDKRIKVIHKKNGGVCSARNVGLKLSKGYYIGFVDPDDFCDLKMFEKLINSSDNGKYDIICCNNYYGNDDCWKINRPYIKNNIMNNVEFQNFCCLYDGTVWNCIYKKNILKNKQFDETIYVLEDLLFNMEFSNNIKVFYVNEPLYYYYYNPSGVIRNKIDKSNFKKSISAIYAMEKIIDIAENNNLKITNQIKLRYILDVRIKLFSYDLPSDDVSHFKNVLKKYSKVKIYFLKGKLNLKLKVLLISISPKLYFFIKKVF